MTDDLSTADAAPAGMPALQVPPLAVRSHGSALPAELVSGCLDNGNERDSLFARGWRSGTGCLTVPQRCAIAGVTGHVAESVAELLLEEHGWHVLWHLVGPGRHG